MEYKKKMNWLLNNGLFIYAMGLKQKKIVNTILAIGFLLFSLLYLYDYIMILGG